MFRVEKTLIVYIQGNTLGNKRFVYKIEKVERTGPRKGKTRAKWCCCSRFVRKASAFSPKMISLPATLDCIFFLLPLVFKQT